MISSVYDYITGRIDTVILEILANADGTVEEIAEKTGVKREAVYHLLEFLSIAGIVKKQGDQYFVDETIRTIAYLIIDLDDLDYEN
ncbi:helix-turn-helix domain-containing protein [Sulfolobus acidocaldarius]|uniref:helix-turn-helix domain-containing protein n=1 Tax=Sulfolobus acidocaldarius TaxID=2285 RepID=UPI000780B8EB|nr:helix-turn-helix domain-containing protein [Sulfolobus acidocaldarius]